MIQGKQLIIVIHKSRFTNHKNDRRMYKIYINETPLYLKSTDAVQGVVATENELIAAYPGKPKFLLNYVDMLEKSNRLAAITIHAEDVEVLFNVFAAHYKIVEAAGGVVFNQEKNILLIFRRGFWDLPKGKIDAGETKEAAAVREVQEETGLQQLELGESLGETYHTYKEGKTRILKRTYWYTMYTSETNLVPQTEEDIEQAVWVELAPFLAEEDRIYGSIRDVVQPLG